MAVSFSPIQPFSSFFYNHISCNLDPGTNNNTSNTGMEHEQKEEEVKPKLMVLTIRNVQHPSSLPHIVQLYNFFSYSYTTFLPHLMTSFRFPIHSLPLCNLMGLLTEILLAQYFSFHYHVDYFGVLGNQF